MKDCTHCKHANWDNTAAGKLHPSGDGRCEYPWKMPQLPACMYWIGKADPKPCGGSINRHRELTDHCPYYQQENK